MVLRSALEVRSATAFGEAIIALVYVPILTLEGVEGKMFRPMALTVLFALGGAFVLSLTFVPALASLRPARRGDRPPEPRGHPGAEALRARAPRYDCAPLGHRGALHWRVLVRERGRRRTAGMGVHAAAGRRRADHRDQPAAVAPRWKSPCGSPASSSARCVGFPEVRTVVVKTGRPEIANDPMGVEQSDVYVMLTPRDEWPRRTTREALVARMDAALRAALPGVAFGFSQPIEMRMNELVSGVRADSGREGLRRRPARPSRAWGARIARVLGRVPRRGGRARRSGRGPARAASR